jgi:hypothetical protein
MDIDVTHLGKLTEEERKCLQAKGHCFFCRAQGHVSKACPKKKGATLGGTNAARPANPCARTMEVGEAADDTAPTTTSKTTLQMIRGMNEEARTQLLDSLILEGQDF